MNETLQRFEFIRPVIIFHTIAPSAEEMQPTLPLPLKAHVGDGGVIGINDGLEITDAAAGGVFEPGRAGVTAHREFCPFRRCPGFERFRKVEAEFGGFVQQNTAFLGDGCVNIQHQFGGGIDLLNFANEADGVFDVLRWVRRVAQDEGQFRHNVKVLHAFDQGEGHVGAGFAALVHAFEGFVTAGLCTHEDHFCAGTLHLFPGVVTVTHQCIDATQAPPANVFAGDTFGKFSRARFLDEKIHIVKFEAVDVPFFMHVGDDVGYPFGALWQPTLIRQRDYRTEVA